MPRGVLTKERFCKDYERHSPIGVLGILRNQLRQHRNHRDLPTTKDNCFKIGADFIEHLKQLCYDVQAIVDEEHDEIQADKNRVSEENTALNYSFLGDPNTEFIPWIEEEEEEEEDDFLRLKEQIKQLKP